LQLAASAQLAALSQPATLLQLALSSQLASLSQLAALLQIAVVILKGLVAGKSQFAYLQRQRQHCDLSVTKSNVLITITICYV
jgi:hypothetical protein